MDGRIVRHQGPHLCSPVGRAKLFFSLQARNLLDKWTHNSHLLPPNYSACVTGLTKFNIAHTLTFSMVRNEISTMVSKIASTAASTAVSTAALSAGFSAALTVAPNAAVRHLI